MGKGAFFASKRRHLLLSKTLIGPPSFAVIVRWWAGVAGAQVGEMYKTRETRDAGGRDSRDTRRGRGREFSALHQVITISYSLFAAATLVKQHCHQLLLLP